MVKDIPRLLLAENFGLALTIVLPKIGSRHHNCRAIFCCYTCSQASLGHVYPHSRCSAGRLKRQSSGRPSPTTAEHVLQDLAGQIGAFVHRCFWCGVHGDRFSSPPALSDWVYPDAGKCFKAEGVGFNC